MIGESSLAAGFEYDLARARESVDISDIIPLAAA